MIDWTSGERKGGADIVLHLGWVQLLNYETVVQTKKGIERWGAWNTYPSFAEQEELNADGTVAAYYAVGPPCLEIAGVLRARMQETAASLDTAGGFEEPGASRFLAEELGAVAVPMLSFLKLYRYLGLAGQLYHTTEQALVEVYLGFE